jgi:hypothetical protein
VGHTLGLSRVGRRECQRGRRAADTPGPEEEDLGAGDKALVRDVDHCSKQARPRMEDGTLLLMYRSLCSLQIETCVTVHLQHMTTLPQEPTPQQPINNNSLPTMWRLESRNTYTGTDGTYWRLLDHSQASVGYLKIKAAAGVQCFSF